MSEIVSISGASKRFSRTMGGQRRLLRSEMLRAITGLNRKSRPELRPEEFWALDNINLSINAGESIGLVGPNGAGKSTLMKLIAKIISPDFGSAEIRAPVSKLISLAAEFQMNLTGRENVYLVGAVRGLNYNEIGRHFDQILDFAELHDFIDAPFHTYSQGMRLRLAFSVAVHIRAPIMLIDEVLAVGDIKFRQKCLRKLTELRSQTTYLMASHSNGYISQFCERTLILNDGKILYDGPTRKALAIADELMAEGDGSVAIGTAGERRLGKMHNTEALADVQAGWQNSAGDYVSTMELGKLLNFVVRFRVKRSLADILNVHVQIGGLESDTLMSFSNRSSKVVVEAGTGDIVTLTASLVDVTLKPGRHGCAIAIFDGAELLYRDDLPAFTVESNGHQIWGELQVRPSWNINVQTGIGSSTN